MEVLLTYYHSLPEPSEKRYEMGIFKLGSNPGLRPPNLPRARLGDCVVLNTLGFSPHATHCGSLSDCNWMSIMGSMGRMESHE